VAEGPPPIRRGLILKTVTTALLDNLSETARTNARLRMNHNLHPALDAPIQRLAIAMEPETYVRPHRHMQSWELLIPLRGSFLFTEFDDVGNVLSNQLLGGRDGLRALEFDAGTWHTVTSLEPGSVIFEVKEGPYVPVQSSDAAGWAPLDGTPEAVAFVEKMRSAALA
jgi:cupin fold WbuC family metalloprotein